jgi:anti-anti-sigma regulatory factor
MVDVVRVSQSGPCLDLQVEGRGSVQQCPAMRRWLEERLARGADTVRVDLCRSSHLDSTFVGTLLMVHRRLSARGGRLVLLAPSPGCCQALEQMHVRDQFSIEADRPPPRDWQNELRPDASAATTYLFKQYVVEAHQELARTEGPAGAQFRDVAAQLAQELPPPPKRPGSLSDTIAID